MLLSNSPLRFGHCASPSPLALGLAGHGVAVGRVFRISEMDCLRRFSQGGSGQLSGIEIKIQIVQPLQTALPPGKGVARPGVGVTGRQPARAGVGLTRSRMEVGITLSGICRQSSRIRTRYVRLMMYFSGDRPPGEH